jgi:hypothetical protein
MNNNINQIMTNLYILGALVVIAFALVVIALKKK